MERIVSLISKQVVGDDRGDPTGAVTVPEQSHRLSKAEAASEQKRGYPGSLASSTPEGNHTDVLIIKKLPD